MIARSSVLMIKRSLSVRSDAIPLVFFPFFSSNSSLFLSTSFSLSPDFPFHPLLLFLFSFGLMTSASPITTLNSFFVSLSSILPLSLFIFLFLSLLTSVPLLTSFSPASHSYSLSRSSFRISVVLASSPIPFFP